MKIFLHRLWIAGSYHLENCGPDYYTVGIENFPQQK